MSEPPRSDPAGPVDVEAHAEQSPLLGDIERQASWWSKVVAVAITSLAVASSLLLLEPSAAKPSQNGHIAKLPRVPKKTLAAHGKARTMLDGGARSAPKDSLGAAKLATSKWKSEREKDPKPHIVFVKKETDHGGTQLKLPKKTSNPHLSWRHQSNEAFAKIRVLLSHSADLCASISALAGAARSTTSTVDLAPCSGLAVGETLLANVAAKEKPTVKDVLANLDASYLQLAKKLDVSAEQLKAQMEEDVDPMWKQLEASQPTGHITDADEHLNLVAGSYRALLSRKEMKMWLPILGLDQLESYCSVQQFGNYLEAVMSNKPKQSPWSPGSNRRLALPAVARFLRANSQVLLLRFANCAAGQSLCSADYIFKYASKMQKKLLGYKSLVEGMCLYDISGKRLSELLKGCFNHPLLHHPDEYDSLTGDLGDLPDGVTQLHFASNDKITGDLRALARFPDMTRLDFFANTKITGDIKWLKGMTQLTFLRFHAKRWLTGDLDSFQNLKNLTYLDFHSAELITGDLWYLRKLKQLKFLSFSRNAKIFGDLTWLSGLQKLKFMDFYWNQQITGDLSSLQNLKSLTHLDFESNQKITGDLASLEKMTNLNYLGLADGKGITGDVRSLSKMKSLNFLDLRGSRITAARRDREVLMASTSLRDGYAAWPQPREEVAGW